MSEPNTGIIIRLLGPLSALGLTLVLLYLSRFWIWVGPWSQEGLFGLKIVSQSGNLVNFWLQGTWWESFDIIIWGCGAFLLLTVLQRLAHWFAK
jgi:hypothetical protein